MLNKNTVLSLLIFTQAHAVSAEPIRLIENPTIYISSVTDLKINQDTQSTLESFVRNWSQFEILVDKQLFPIEAPNCKNTIQIRFKGIEPVKNHITQIQKSRWELLERIKNGNHQNAPPVFLRIDTKLYMQKSADGKYTLDYCNVFVE